MEPTKRSEEQLIIPSKEPQRNPTADPPANEESWIDSGSGPGYSKADRLGEKDIL